MSRTSLCCAVVLCVAAPAAHAAALTSTIDDQKSVEVTVYNSNIGLVKETRHLQLPQGEGELRFMDVASGIMPYTVQVRSLDPAAGMSVLEQNYEYDLINADKLLNKYIGKGIKIVTISEQTGTKETVDAQLLGNNDGQQVLKINNEIYLGYPGIRILPEMSENLVAKPTLTWLYGNKSAGPQDLQVSYLTNGITWQADYIVTANSNDTSVDLSGWVTLDNRSGAAYKNAKLKLVAGQVNRVAAGMEAGGSGVVLADRMAAAAPPQFQEQALFEYHMYDLQRPTTIKDNETKQVQLLQAAGVRVEKEYLVYANRDYFYTDYSNADPSAPLKSPVNVYLKFKNSKDNQLGMPLPAGTMRLYKEDAGKSLQFIGEDAITHTPKDENVELKVGEAFDVVAERVQTSFQQQNRYYQSSWEITLRNHKDGNVKVGVIEPAEGDWTVITSSVPYKKVNASTLRFDMDVPKDGEAKITYTVRVKTP